MMVQVFAYMRVYTCKHAHLHTIRGAGCDYRFCSTAG